MKKYILILQFDNTDPQTYGPYDSPEEAEMGLKTLTRKWDDRDWYHLENGGGYSINELTK